MRYIFLNPIKTNEDKERVKNLTKLPQKDLQKLIKDKTETKVITDKTKISSQSKKMINEKNIYDEVKKTILSKNNNLINFIKKDFKEKKPTPEINIGDETFLLNDLDSTATDLFYIIKIRENKSNDIKIYDDIYSQIKGEIKDVPKPIKDDFLKLPNIASVSNANVKNNLKSLVILGLKMFDLSKSIKPAVSGAEVGEGNKTDQYSSKKCTDSNPVPNPKGFLANLNWPLKSHLTSVKHQGKRGTCTAFGTIAAIESMISVRYGKKVNLSEQDLYKKQKLDWNPNIIDDYYDDGYNPIFSMLFQMINGYVFPFESAWEYNKSFYRTQNDNLRKYYNSCKNYNGFCSDTNHQSKKSCYVMDITDTIKVVNEVCDFVDSIPFIGLIGGWVCHNVTEWIDEVVDQVEVCVYDTEIPGNSRYKLTDFTLIWDPIFDNDISLAKYALSRKKPIIFCFKTAKSFRENHSTADGKGFVVYSATEAIPEGGHCVEMVGYIDNNMIPSNLNITPGSGGGYFIIKNSYGKCFGDMGFAYLPYDWVRRFGTAMVSINNVQKV